MNKAAFIALLFLTGKITSSDADLLAENMESGALIPKDWRGVIGEIERIIGKCITN